MFSEESSFLFIRNSQCSVRNRRFHLEFVVFCEKSQLPTHSYSLLLTPTHSNSLLLTPTHSNSYPLSGGEGRSRRRRSAKRGAPGGPGEGVRRREMPGCPPVPGEGVRRREMPGCPPVSPFRPQRKKIRSPVRSQISTLLGSSFGSILHRLHCAYVANAFVASQLPRPGLTCI